MKTTETEVRERIQFVLTTRSVNAHSLGAGDYNLWKKIYNQFNRGKTITMSSIEALLNAVPDLSAEWLFRGEGEPFLSHSDNTTLNTSSPTFHIDGDNSIAINGNVSIQQQVIELLIQKDAVIAEKDTRISELTDKLLTLIGN